MRLIGTFLFLLCFFAASAQPPTYNMSNLTVSDCEGILLDSENGDLPGTYDHNEDYTFTIAIPGATEIILSFTSFCTEEDFDFLTIYDGPTTSSPIIGGPFSGEIDPPVTIATSGYMTLHFTTDPNVVCTGWFATWTTEVDIPEPPNILPIQDLACDQSSMTITFDEGIPCGDFVPEAFTLTGPLLPTITSVEPLNCTNGLATSVRVNFNPPLDRSGSYQIIFNNSIRVCNITYPVISQANFNVVGCPLFVDLTLDTDTLCLNGCTVLRAKATGGNASSYTYMWSEPNTGNQDSIIVCFTDTTTYSVTVTDAEGAMVSNSILVEPLPMPIISMGDTTLCKSVDTLELTTTIAGGLWYGEGIVDQNPNAAYYIPKFIESSRDTIIYVAPSGCTDTTFVNLVPLDQGGDDATCPFVTPLLVSGGSPAGGIWSGPFMSEDGWFTPDSIGVFTIRYTHPNGCFGEKNINVDFLNLPPVDTVCQSLEPFEIPVTPVGGIWTGEGIIDSTRFDPSMIIGGGVQLYYAINGCRDSVYVPVKQIDARNNFSACPLQEPFVLPGNWGPSGGFWTGEGIVNSSTGLYDPSIITPGRRDTLIYTLDGCTDFRTVYVDYTQIRVEDTLQFCLQDARFELDVDNTRRIPGGGVWSGPGVVNTNVEMRAYAFFPSEAGAGLHTIYYDRNTCIDSMHIRVFSRPDLNLEALCTEGLPIDLEASIEGGIWGGTGIINADLGIFDPNLAGEGTHTLTYSDPNGCVTEEDIAVIPFREASLSGIEENYCFKDTTIVLQSSPAGGDLLVNGIANTTFNPAEIGQGTHTVEYTLGEGACEDTDRIFVTVGAPIDIDLPVEADSICSGYSLTISAQAFGGTGGNYTYTWNNGLGEGSIHYPEPTTSTNYTVTVSDGCSDSASGTIAIFVHPRISIEIETGEPVCYEDTTFAMIDVYPEGDYNIAWNSSPIHFGNTIVSHPRSYTVTVTNNGNECFLEEVVDLPGFDLLTANFDVTPVNECVDLLDPTIHILDFSVNGRFGEWDFGDGSATEGYRFGGNVSHIYQDTGNYVVSLQLVDEGNCISTHEVTVCVESAVRLFAPNAFTPNFDGSNDEFGFKGFGIESIHWQVYNRWGELLYEGQDIDQRWDGYYKGKKVGKGVYTYMAKYKPYGIDEERILKGFVTVVY